MTSKVKSSIRYSLILALMSTVSVAAHAAPVQKAKPSPTPMATPVEITTPAPTPVATPVAEVLIEPTPVPHRAVETSGASSLLVGPFVSAVAVPRPLNAGLEVKFADVFGISGGYGFLPQLTISDVKVKLTGWDVRAKVYPFLGSFFIGVGYGSQTLTGSQTRTISGQTVTGNINQDNTFFFPHLGWNWGSNSPGFFMGIDLGVQLSLKRNSTFTTDANVAIQATPEYSDLRKDVLDKAETIGKTPLPLLTLVKVGYLF